MKRITKVQKDIADRHIDAKFADKFDDVDFNDISGIISGLKAGKAYREILDEVELRHVNITSLMIGAVLAHKTKAYQAGVYSGFKKFLTGIGIE
jgi:hypothetical protein